MKVFVSFVILYIQLISVFGQSTTFSEPIIYAGRIGNLPVELEISEYDLKNKSFSGRYRYIKHKKYIELKGTTHEPCLEMEEIYKGKTTGHIYLEMDGNRCQGYWSNGVRAMEMELSLIKGDLNEWRIPKFSDKIIQANSSLSGTYETSWSFVNPQFYPVIEIGYNSAILTVETIDQDSIKFMVEAVCGPTYHFAYAEGYAVKREDYYIYESTEEGFETCQIQLKFDRNEVYVTANQSMACGFGMRAYLNHTLSKVSNTISER
jgi:hypothetical protein